MITKNNGHIGAIIQARTTSTRLPQKIFLDLDGLPVLEQIIIKLQKVELINSIVIATTNDAKDKKLVKWCRSKKYNYFIGEKKNVLSRFYYCAKKYKFDSIVRITSDNPLIDIEIVNKTIKLFLKGYDYTANNIIKTFPHGLDVEVFSFDSLKKSFIEAKNNSHKEHVTQYIRNNPDLFKIANLKSDKNFNDIRITLDTEEDYQLIKMLVNKAGINVSYNRLIEIFKKNKELKDINRQSKEEHSIYNKINKII